MVVEESDDDDEDNEDEEYEVPDEDIDTPAAHRTCVILVDGL